MMQPEAARGYFPLIHKMLTGELSPLSNHGLPEKHADCSLYSLDQEQKPVCQAGSTITENPGEVKDQSLFILDVFGAITKYDQLCAWGMASKAQWLSQADKNPNILGHIIRIDSPGGEGYAALMFAQKLQSLQKPVFAFVEGMAASAAYWIASATSFIGVSSSMDRVGSIGTYITLADYSQWYNQQGVRLVDVYAQKSSEKNRDYLEAIKGNTSRIQSLVDSYNDIFLNQVMQSRKETLSEDTLWQSGKMFFAHEALENGLIDHVSGFEGFVKNIIEHLRSTQ